MGSWRRSCSRATLCDMPDGRVRIKRKGRNRYLSIGVRE